MEELDISLFSHNEAGYEALCTGLENYPLAFLEHATGTGKSFILLKYLYKKMRHKRILFISMHDEMFGQLFDEQMPSLGMNRLDFNTFDTMIYHNILKYNMQDIIRNYDCIVCDEAHHCGAEKWSEKIRELKELILNTPGKVMIGATATGIRYLDDYLDVSEEFFGGHTVSRLPIAKSILNNLLPAPLYVNSLAACKGAVERVQSKLAKLPKTEELLKYSKRVNEIGSEVDKESEIGTVLKEYDVKPGEKYIVFCKNIDDLNQKRKEAENWFKSIGPIKTFAAHSGQKKEQNKSEIKAFSEKRPEISLMFAVDIFNEGFHINGVDGILMFRKTQSPTVYFQQLGRALSYSARKKQIKIFDFVDNISDNDVIYELYKEIIEEARRLTIKHPENKELYENILKRFQIIDHTTTILDELREMERIINENYIFKNMLNNAIMKLQEYRSFYPKADFSDGLTKKNISYDYIRAYEYICKNSEHLTPEQIDLLQTLNIDFGAFANLPKNERKEVLRGFRTLAELNEEIYKNFIKSYIEFYRVHNRRPNKSSDDFENTLYHQHRNYLDELPKSKITKMILSFPFKATVEEKVLTENYPDKKEIEEYIATIKEKILNNINLDSIEVKVIKKLRKTISLKDTKLIAMLNNVDDIAYRIETSIEVLRKYKLEVNPNEKFTNKLAFAYNKELHKAISTIHKYAKRITTPQFVKLLELDISLPPAIAMTLEKRIELLGPYNSFYEKEKNDTISILNEFIIFIVQNSRRPNPNLEEEKELAESYEKHIQNSTTVKIREVCELLKANRIELTFYEKVIIGEPIEKDILDSYINQVYQSLLENDNVSAENLKILRAIERYSYDITLPFLGELIKIIVGIRDITEDIDKLEDKVKKYKGLDLDDLPPDIKYAIKKLSSNQKYLTKSLLSRLIKLGIKISPSIKEEILSLTNCVNLAHHEVLSNNSFLNEFYEYLKINHKRPEENTNLSKRYRIYLGNLSNNKCISFIKSIISYGIIPTLEEKIILGNIDFNSFEVRKYIEEKRTKLELDGLEKKVLNILHKKVPLIDDRKLNQALRAAQRKKTIDRAEDQIVSSLMENIYRNPDAALDFNSSIHNLSNANQRKLENTRQKLLAKRFFENTIRELKRLKKPLKSVLSTKEQEQLKEYLKLDFATEADRLLITELKALDTEYALLERGVEKSNFVKAYISFIESNYGNKPNISSTNPAEKQLAEQYLIIRENLSNNDLRLIEKAIKDATHMIVEETFYDRFHRFIIENGRFPCGNSDNPEEVQLNSLYVTMSDTFTKEQLKELQKLKKLYSRATLQANLAFAKKIKK